MALAKQEIRPSQIEVPVLVSPRPTGPDESGSKRLRYEGDDKQGMTQEAQRRAPGL
jgi:hypothetical protein